MSKIKNRPRSQVSLDWLFGKHLSPEEQERRRREEKIKDLLPDEDEDTIGAVYDSRLLTRLFHYMRPYRLRLVMAVILMPPSCCQNSMVTLSPS